ncbi:biliverdin-producing heme oxygenase [Tautonia plasticadhaerens]|uniref:Heme oxygenase n=1 Tax=Tautonia plasticadhaerens TaxID=2527974 RepID=A0A518GVS3_9BACT|nr:biliverdin-producing heme oxygenase [Tautonia plasticadhaerens]QDV32659.1 Heme oxygenase [Tautonia plasticadhaerens]
MSPGIPARTDRDPVPIPNGEAGTPGARASAGAKAEEPGIDPAGDRHGPAPADPGGPSILARLRHETRSHHEAIERVVDVDRLGASRSAYVRLLRGFLGYYEPLEGRLAGLPWEASGLDFRERRKAGWLREDLRSLDPDGPPCPTCPDLPEPVDLARGLGCLYVVEGATLGGRVVLRLIGDRLGIGPESGGRFYSGYRARTGAMWASFGRFAEAHVAAHPDRADAVVEAASETFDSLRRWLSGTGPGR